MSKAHAKTQTMMMQNIFFSPTGPHDIQVQMLKTYFTCLNSYLDYIVYCEKGKLCNPHQDTVS